ncbi:PAS domain S-box protein [Candidatus Nitronereus thalassa]|uniref:histidine kinase n=1 Tax=Candidatus Nitronereus thalassa TaxID=3020898 RepID=A0ABU3K8T4_9BACT|nr:PAS domain S-box protein [Candidatus Nitronereus thalassa]MDT7042822.1 PAS domain S-box protein [Candidatus Nitronereus thalassa]
MDDRHHKEVLIKELQALQQEIGELRAVESMHRETQEGFQAIEVQLAGIIHSAMDGIITVNDSQHVVLFNAAAEQMFGYSAKEAIGQPIDIFIPDRFRDAHRRHIEVYGETQGTNRRMGALGSISGLRRNGEEFPIEASISQFKRGDHRFYTVILRDVTERTQVEESLARLGRLLDESVNEIFLFDAQTLKFTQVNKGAQENLGYSMDELMNMTPVDIKPEFTWETFQELLKPLYDGRKDKMEFSTFHRRKNGSDYPVEVHLQLSQLRQSQVFLAIILDISDRKVLESQLRQTERLAEMGTLAAGMAHEIGTPMNVILGRAEYLMRKTSEESTKQGLATIVTQVERITKIMNQLLSFARRRSIERRPMVLASVVHDMLDVVQDRLKRQQVHLVLNLEGTCPKVFADSDQIRQVILNLVMNAIQAMETGGTLRISQECKDSSVYLSIADTGCGISKENIPKLFTPFFTTKEVGEGTGLGLTVVHGIIQEHEGTIRVESQKKKGATFIISLPIFDSTRHST